MKIAVIRVDCYPNCYPTYLPTYLGVKVAGGERRRNLSVLGAWDRLMILRVSLKYSWAP